jgi:hypothetical protein
MKIYKVAFKVNESSAGFYFTSSLKDAESRKKNAEGVWDDGWDKEITTIEITPTKKGIIAALNFHASHNDNG